MLKHACRHSDANASSCRARSPSTELFLGEQDEAELSANQQQQLENQRRKYNGDNVAAREALARSRTRLIGLRQSLATAENITLRFNRLLQDGAASEMQALESQTQGG